MLRNKINEKMDGKSIKALGEEIGVAYSTIHRIVKTEDLSNIPLGNVVAIARSLSVDINELYEDVIYKVYTMEIFNGKEDVSDTLYEGDSHEDCLQFIHEDFDEHKYSRDVNRGDKVQVIYNITAYKIIDNEEQEVDGEDLIFNVNEIFEKKEKYEDYEDILSLIKEIVEYADDIINRAGDYKDPEYIFMSLESLTENVNIEFQGIEMLDSKEELLSEMNRVKSTAKTQGKKIKDDLIKLRKGL